MSVKERFTEKTQIGGRTLADVATASRAPRSSWRPPSSSRLISYAPEGFAQPVPSLPRQLRVPFRAAYSCTTQRLPRRSQCRETGSTSPPVSQTKSCCFSFNSFTFVVLLLIADGPLDDASRAFNDVEHGWIPCDARHVMLLHSSCGRPRVSDRQLPSCGRVLCFL